MRMDKVSATLYIPTIYADALVFVGLVFMSFYTLLEILHNYAIFQSGSVE
jgi:hypothetical protein